MRLLTSVTVLALLTAGAQAQQPTYHAATEADQDPQVATLAGGAMLALPGLFPDFVIAGGGQFVELPNGTARLTGRTHSLGSLYSAFSIEIEFSGRSAPGSTGYPPAGAPLLSLLPTAYVPTGSVDPSTFVYYTAATGTLIGTHDYDGAVIDVLLTSQPAQIGYGANNRNGELGLEATLQLTVVQQPATPFVGLSTATLTCDLPNDRTDKATHPEVDASRSALPFGRALVLPGINDDYVFVPAGELTEYDDGHVEITGRLSSISQLDDAWQLTLSASNRVDPGEIGHPPTGSPVLQMLPSAYAGSGGTVDPGHWRYYQSTNGTLAGLGINLGGSISLSSTTALQVGSGANQTNFFHGCYGAFSAAVTTQPAARTIALTGDPELFAIGNRLPVLPFPVLTAPTTQHSLPTLTDQGFVVQGDHLAWVELVAVGTNLAGLGDESRWYHGWFRVIDNQHLEVHPRPGLAPGIYDLRALNPAVISNLLYLTLTAPTAPAMYAEAEIGALQTLHLMMHRGPASPQAVSVIGLSFSLQPTILPGLVSLGIGNQGLELAVIGGSFGHDPATGIAQFDIGPIPPGFTGFSIHYQAVIADLTNFVLPLPATNVWSVGF